MKLRLQACLWLGLAVPACDRPEQPAPPAEGVSVAPTATRPARPPRGNAPDARTKLRAALSSAAEIESLGERDSAIAKIAWEALELDPELAREALEKLTPDSAERIRLIQHVAMRKAEEHVDEALKWAASLGTEAERAAATGHVALVISDTDPERAANLLSESGIAGRDFEVVVVQVLGRWAERSPADAAAWVELFPPGESREAGIRTVISSWAEADPAAAFSWMAGIQDDAVRKETAMAMAAAMLRHPEDVREVWLSHADPRVRGEIDDVWKAAQDEVGNPARPPSE